MLTTTKNKLLLPVLCLLATFPACTTESVDIPVETETVTLSLYLPGVSGTRALDETDECTVNAIDVLLFNNSEYAGTCQGINLINGEVVNEKKFDVELPQGTFDMLVIANCRAILTAAPLTEGMTREQVQDLIIFEMEQMWGYTPATFTAFPMCGELENINIQKGTTEISQTIYLVRAAVRIDVDISPVYTNGNYYPSHLGLESVRLYNRNKKGQVIPDYATITATETNFTVTRPSIPDGTAIKEQSPLIYYTEPEYVSLTVFYPATLEATIYTFEALKGTYADWRNNTCLVIGTIDPNVGIVRSERPDNNKWYYRVDFLQNPDFKDDDNYMHLKRNHKYIVEVQNIINQGFTDPDEAFRSELYNLEYSITELETVYPPEIEIPGMYRIDISESDLMVEIGSTYQVTVCSTHPDGWTYAVSDNPDTIVPVSWLTVTLDRTPDQDAVVDMTIKVEANAVPYEYGYIHITSGNLTTVIKVWMVPSVS